MEKLSEINEDYNRNSDETIDNVFDICQFKFTLEKVECEELEHMSEFSQKRCFVTDEANLKSRIKCNFDITKKDLSNGNINDCGLDNCQKIIPNKLATIDDHIFFTYCIVDQNQNLIRDFIFSITNSKLNKRISLSALDLGIKLPNINFGSLAGYKFFSNFFVFERENLFGIFMVVYHHVYIIKLDKINENDTNENSHNEQANKTKYEIIFKREYINSNLLMILGFDRISYFKTKFFILMKPNQKILIFTCKRKNEKIKVSFEEKDIKNLNKTDINNNLALTRALISNNSEIIFYDNTSNKLFLTNKPKMNKIRYLEDSNKELSVIKNFLILSEKNKPNLYLLTDETINDDVLIVKIWKIKTDISIDTNMNNNSNDDSVECEKIQTIKIKSSEGSLGLYNFTLIDDNHIALCFYESDEIFILGYKSNNNLPESNIYIERIYELNFEELFALMFDFMVTSDKKLRLTLYQEEEFFQYEIDLKLGEKVGTFDKIHKLVKLPTIINNSAKSKVEDINSENNCSPCVENINTIKLNNFDASDINNINNINNFASSASFPSPLVKDRENETNNINSNSTEKNYLSDFKKSISDKFITKVEEKLDKLIKSKLNSFTDDLNNKLSDVFSFMKKQTDELEGIRKKNNEAMVNVTNLILKSQENLSLKNKSTHINNNPKPNNGNIPNYGNIPNNLQFNMNNPLYNKNVPQLNPNYNIALMRQYQQQMQMIPNEYMNNLNYLNSGAKKNHVDNNFPNRNNNIKPNLNYPLGFVENNFSNNQINQKNNLMYQNYANGFNPTNSNENMLNKQALNTNNNVNNFMFNAGNMGMNANFSNMKMKSNHLEMTVNDNKYKEDEIVREIEKKFSEIKNEENLGETNINNLSLNFNNEDNKLAVNYSSDISSGNFESDVNINLIKEVEKANENLKDTPMGSPKGVKSSPRKENQQYENNFIVPSYDFTQVNNSPPHIIKRVNNNQLHNNSHNVSHNSM